jgi:hypothetical protein
MRNSLILVVLLAVCSSSALARPSRSLIAPECNISMPCDISGWQTGRGRTTSVLQAASYGSSRIMSSRVRMTVADAGTGVVGGRPAGCPHAFCGCGASLRVFGRIVPELNLASNWLRFPRTSPAPGMVAARRGHVFVLEQQVEGDVWMAYDANSGGRATRIHARSLRGYTVVNPRAA